MARIPKVRILRGWRECAECGRVRVGVDGLEELHVGDVVDVNVLFEDHDEAFPVQFYGEDRGYKG